MITKCEDSEVFLSICDKLKEVKDCRLKENVLYNYMISSLYSQDIFTCVSFDKGKMNGCLVFMKNEDNLGDLILVLIFIWIDPHYPKLLGEYIEFANNKAREFNAKRLSFTTGRNEEVIKRRMGKFGFKKTFSTFEKDVM